MPWGQERGRRALYLTTSHLRDNCFDKASRSVKMGSSRRPKAFFINVTKYLHVAALWCGQQFFLVGLSRQAYFTLARIRPAAWLCQLSGSGSFQAADSGWRLPAPRCWQPHKSHCHSKWINFRDTPPYTPLLRIHSLALWYTPTVRLSFRHSLPFLSICFSKGI